MQYICSEKPVSLLQKGKALTRGSQCFDMAHAMHCLNRYNASPLLCQRIAFHPTMNRLYFAKKAPFFFCSSLNVSFPVMLNLFSFVQFAYARHSSSKLVSALAQSQISASVRGEVIEMTRCEILKRVIRPRSSKTSLFFRIRYGQHDICVLKTQNSRLITHCSLLTASTMQKYLLLKGLLFGRWWPHPHRKP